MLYYRLYCESLALQFCTALLNFSKRKLCRPELTDCFQSGRFVYPTPTGFTFWRCMFLVSCSSSMFCSFLFISRRFSSPGFTRSLKTELKPPRSPWTPWANPTPPDTSARERERRLTFFYGSLCFLSVFSPVMPERSWINMIPIGRPLASVESEDSRFIQYTQQPLRATGVQSPSGLTARRSRLRIG